MTDTWTTPDWTSTLTGLDIREARRRRLTDRQRICLDFIRSSTAANGYPPTLREIGRHMSIGSTNGVNDRLAALERKGYIRRADLKSRGIVVVDQPSSPIDPQATAIEAWKTENGSLRTLLKRTAEAIGRAPAISAEMAVLVGDIRAVLSAGDA